MGSMSMTMAVDRSREVSSPPVAPRVAFVSAPRPEFRATMRAAAPVECPRVAPNRGYRMGRFERLSMTIVLVAAVVVATFVSLGSGDPQGSTVVVRPGDTPLSMALDYLPEMDPARAVELIAAANGVTDLHLAAGQTLLIPSSH